MDWPARAARTSFEVGATSDHVFPPDRCSGPNVCPTGMQVNRGTSKRQKRRPRRSCSRAKPECPLESGDGTAWLRTKDCERAWDSEIHETHKDSENLLHNTFHPLSACGRVPRVDQPFRKTGPQDPGN